MAPSNQMLPWLGAAARTARERRKRLRVHVAAHLDVNEETIGRFERGQRWPADPDRTIGGYAEDLGIHPREIWEDALEHWRTAG